MHFGCVEIVEQHAQDALLDALSTSNMLRSVVSRRDVTSQVEFGL